MRRADVSVAELARPETAWALMEPWNVTPENARLERHAVYTFRGRWAKQWRRGRVFLAGDAAHLMPPFMGQGLCSGLRDASSLSWRLSMVLSGLAGDGALDSYGTERLAHVREIIDVAVGIGELVCELDPARAAERDKRMSAQLHDPDVATVEPPHPRLGTPSITLAGSRDAGTLSLQARVAFNGISGLFDDVVGGAWQLVGLDADPLASVSDDVKDWFAGIGGNAVALGRTGASDLEGLYRAWFDAHGCTVFLTRPDFYIFGTGTHEQVPGILAALRESLRAPITQRKALT
jgi:3-(3-hydroxy-phenyl)propionate hydroxylase